MAELRKHEEKRMRGARKIGKVNNEEVNFMMASKTVQIGIERHLRNIEREFVQVKKLMEVLTSQHIQALRKELAEEGFDKALIELVGSVPVWEEDYKQDIRRVISQG